MRGGLLSVLFKFFIEKTRVKGTSKRDWQQESERENGWKDGSVTSGKLRLELQLRYLLKYILWNHTGAEKLKVAHHQLSYLWWNETSFVHGVVLPWTSNGCFKVRDTVGMFINSLRGSVSLSVKWEYVPPHRAGPAVSRRDMKPASRHSQPDSHYPVGQTEELVLPGLAAAQCHPGARHTSSLLLCPAWVRAVCLWGTAWL